MSCSLASSLLCFETFSNNYSYLWVTNTTLTSSCGNLELDFTIKLRFKFSSSARLVALIHHSSTKLRTSHHNTQLVSRDWELLSDFSKPNKMAVVSESTFFSTTDSRRDAMTAKHHICFVWQRFVLVLLQLSHYCKCRRHACYPLKGIWLDLRGNGASVTEANLDNGGPVHVWRRHAEKYQCQPYKWDRNEIRILSIKAQVWDCSD